VKRRIQRWRYIPLIFDQDLQCQDFGKTLGFMFWMSREFSDDLLVDFLIPYVKQGRRNGTACI
jgi:hypothetical protein